jgi:predicted transposase YdaD
MNRLNPLNDYIFKRLMEETEHLIAFLNAVLDVKDQQRLISLEIINSKELTAEMIHDKASRLDVWAKTADGMQLNIEIHKGNPLHRWLKFLDKNTSEEELKELSEMDQAIRNVEAKLEYLSSDAETIALYRAREATLHERANMINSAKAEGRIEGETEKAIRMAQNLLAMGIAVETIAKAAELPVEKIMGLQKQPQHWN